MKTDFTHILTTAEALQLMERYFEAETSEQEEKVLKQFITSPAGASVQFNELRAVMGLAAFGKQMKHGQSQNLVSKHRNRSYRTVTLLRWSVAAVLCIAFGVSLSVYNFRQENQCIAYIHGQKITDSQQVIAAMHCSLADVGAPTETPSVETQLNDIFQTIE